MPLRRSTVYLGITSGLVLTLASMLLDASARVREAGPALQRKSLLVGRLDLTDLCLFTEASYTRHLSMADRSAAFQDVPGSLEHFPTGALVAPPPHLVNERVQRR